MKPKVRSRLKELRQAAGLTQEQMARMLGFKSKAHYCMLERGKRGISVENALKIASILNQPVEAIFDVSEVHATQTEDQAAALDAS